MSEFYKIAVNIPPEHADDLMDSVTEAIDPMYPGYDRCFSYWMVKGTWRSLEGSHPYDGTIGEITTADEIRVEFAVNACDLEKAIRSILSIHPYEEPAIDVIPMTGWKSIIPSDGR